MKRILTLAAILAVMGAGTAQAQLTKPEARHAITRYLAKAHKQGENESFAVNDCHRRSKNFIWCHVAEYGLAGEAYGHGNIFYRIKAKKEKGKIRLSAARWGELEKPAASAPTNNAPTGGSSGGSSSGPIYGLARR